MDVHSTPLNATVSLHLTTTTTSTTTTPTIKTTTTTTATTTTIIIIIIMGSAKEHYTLVQVSIKSMTHVHMKYAVLEVMISLTCKELRM